jgi:protein-tyrosine phosphatase
MAARAEILVVCTGNVCRSPFTERLLRAGLAAQWGAAAADVLVHSAGTRALAGRAMHELTSQQLSLYGGNAESFTARQLQPEMTRAASLVLALTRDRVPIVEGHPAAARITFTLREIARLLDGVPPADVSGDTAAERVRALTAIAAGRRGLLPPVPFEEDDVTDPYGGDPRRHELTAREITPAVSTLLRFTAPNDGGLKP